MLSSQGLRHILLGRDDLKTKELAFIVWQGTKNDSVICPRGSAFFLGMTSWNSVGEGQSGVSSIPILCKVPTMDFAAIDKNGGVATGRLLEPDGDKGWAPGRRWGKGVQAVVDERAHNGSQRWRDRESGDATMTRLGDWRRKRMEKACVPHMRR